MQCETMRNTDVESQDDTRGAPKVGSVEPAVARRSSTDSSWSSASFNGTEQRGASKPSFGVGSGFFKASHGSRVDLMSLSTRTERMQYRVAIVLESGYFDFLVGCVMVFDVFLMIADIDSRAGLTVLPFWMEMASNACLAFYSAEFCFALFVHGPQMFRQRVIMIDAFVLLTGYLELLLFLVGADAQQMGILRVMRIIKMMRLIRTARNSPILKELRKLVMMLASCLRILVWSAVFLIIVQTFWGMMAVEFLQPIMRELNEDGVWSDCDLCRTSFSSVARANLTLFKTIIAGDSWGLLAEPMIIHNPWCALLFACSFLSLVFGVMNLVVAVVVDTAAEQRQKDVMSLARDLEEDQEGDLQLLTEIFRKIDADGSGELELDELIKGAEEVPEFQSRLRVMDIDKDDLVQLFHMLDADGGGSISPDEFKHALNRWIYDSKTATRFVKYNVMKLGEEQKALANFLRTLDKKVEKFFVRMTKLSNNKSCTSSESANTQRSTDHLLRPVEGATVSEGTLPILPEQEPASPAPQNVNAEIATISSQLSPRVSFDLDRISFKQDLSRGDVLEAASTDPTYHASPTLLQAGATADRGVFRFLEQAYQVLHESALAAAEASLQDAAANAGVHVRSLLHDDISAGCATLGVPPGEQGPEAVDGGTNQCELEINSFGDEIFQPHESVNFGPRSASCVKLEERLIPSEGGYVKFGFNVQTREELQQHVISANI
eukprot:TRINITY_DN23331_c0_g1_i1.p1 TRINITY_DN23331_c0_g1~~TRINITY_DN23331_c0_g1_i1.p1  ORF type:complete len:721 (+),score=130.98 TRINITY_DN23331_c0_g1_i1:45-2207(+)